MAIPTSKTWPMDPHTDAKHRILRVYLEAWYPIITSGLEGKALIVDGFCGPGEYVKDDGSPGEDGSPVIALKTLLNHRAIDLSQPGKEFVFVFLDEHPERVEHLEKTAIPQRVGALPKSVNVQIGRGQFDVELNAALDDMEARGKRMAPALVLVDPFGWSGVPMSLMHRILAQRKAEVMITFMVQSVNRWLRHAEAKGAYGAHYDALFGTPAWRAIPDGPQRTDRLRDLYEEQLGTEFVRGFRMRDAGNRPLYDLIWAGNHEQGLRKIKDAMWKVDPVKGGSFSDRSAIRPTLFDTNEPDLEPLDDLLLERFAGQATTIEELERFVLRTDFREEHLRKRLRPLEQSGKMLVIVRGGKGKRGTYPKGTELKFL